MNINSLKKDDVVKVNKKGREFEAKYQGKIDGQNHRIIPITSNITWFTCTSREIRKKVSA